MSMPTDDTEHILEAAFSEAFSAPSSRRQSMMPTVGAPSTEEPVVEPPQAPVESSSEAATTEPASGAGAEQDAWKQEYEEQVKTWRAQSAEARERAEKIREEWEAKRAAEREEAAKREVAGVPEPAPEVIPGPPLFVAQLSEQEGRGKEEAVVVENRAEENKAVEDSIQSSSPADARDLVTGEPQGHRASSTVSQSDTIDSSQKWEEVNSLTASSHPSMSFPEETTTPPPQHHDNHHVTRSWPGHIPQTATLSVFDTSLSKRTRLKALASSLAINLLLPFVNGVMLGFGEIFAKNVVVGWLGWGSTVATVGVSQRRRFGKASGSR